MRSLSYFIDVLAIIAFMLILQARNNAETVASDLKKQEEQLNEYIEQIEVVQQFAPQEAIALRRQRDQQVMQDVQGTLMKLQDLYEQKDQSLTEYQQLVAKLQQQSTLELQALQKGSAAELQSTVARLEQEKSKALEAKDEQLRQVKANLQLTLKLGERGAVFLLALLILRLDCLKLLLQGLQLLLPLLILLTELIPLDPGLAQELLKRLLCFCTGFEGLLEIGLHLPELLIFCFKGF